MAQSATVQALTGKVIVIDMAGLPRLLAVGDTVQAGETVRPAPGATVQFALDDGQSLGLDAGQAWLVGADAPVVAEPQLTEAISAVIDVLERGGDLDELEAAAAGVGGGGGGDGSSFVRLLRIVEDVTPQSYAYSLEGRSPIQVVEGGRVVGAEAVPVPGEEPPPPVRNYPIADDDESSAQVVVNRTGGEFMAEARIAGHGPNVLSGHLDHWIASDNSFHLVHGGDHTLKPSFVITDVARSEASFDYVATPKFSVNANDTFQFTLRPNDDLVQDATLDQFRAAVYQRTGDTWSHVADITDPDADGVFTHTFADGGDYRIQFILNDVTNGQAAAEVQIDSDHYFATPVNETVDIVPATGNIFSNDTLGDGDFSQHSWSFSGGLTDPDTGLVTVAGAYGQLVVDPDGGYTYTPTGSGGGLDTFSYTLTDSDGDFDTANLHINVGYTVNGLGGVEAAGPSVAASSYTYAGAEAADLPDFSIDSDGDGIPDALEGGRFTLAHTDDGGDSFDLSDMLDVPEFSAQVLDQYLSFGENDAGHAVMHVATGADLNGDGIPDALQALTFDNVSLLELQAYAGGSSDVEIIQKLLDNGNLRKDG